RAPKPRRCCAASSGRRFPSWKERRPLAEVRYVQATRLYPGTERPAVDALDLHVADGEFIVLVGPSGSGKTTALRMLAGLEEVDAGSVYIGDRDVTFVPPKERDVSMVFQNYALYPYLTVAQNIGFPLKLAKVRKGERDRRVREVAQMLGLLEYLHRKPAQLSGGQRQRVAMGRAIVRLPQVFLMDEPLSNLDAKLRVQMGADAYVFCVADVHGERTKLVARTETRRAPDRGDRITLEPSPDEAHYFDAASGERLAAV